MLGAIIDQARTLRTKILSGGKSSFSPSKIWEHAYDSLHLKAIAEIDDERRFVEAMTENNAFSYPRLVDEPIFPEVVKRYLEYLEREGTPLGSLPANIAESPIVSAKSCTTVDGRRISTMFLHHLCMALRLRSLSEGLDKVVEIGGGYGGLARVMRLFSPNQTYVIVDLIDSLYCSYVFLRTHFPDAKVFFVTDREQGAEIDSYDFVFVPTEFFDILKGSSMDLVANTASFGEMIGSNLDAYMRFINEESSPRYVYSVNRYARFTEEMSLPDQTASSLKLSADWQVLFYDAFGERSFHQLDPCHPPQLEVLAKKVSGEERLTAAREEIAALLAEMARRLPQGSSDWHFCMWEAARLFPSRPLLDRYIQGALPDTFRDAAYYEELKAEAATDLPQLPAGVALAPPQPSKVPAQSAPKAPPASRWWKGLSLNRTGS